MKETLRLPALPNPQSRRFKMSQARLVLLLILAATGFGLLTWTGVLGLPSAGPQEEATQARAGLTRDQIASPGGSLQETLAQADIIPTHHHSLLGRQAPDFALTDHEGKVWKLRELHDGHPVVLIFYYGYHCVSCVRHLFEVGRDLPLFREVGADVVAISADPSELTRGRFQQFGPLGFPVLSDPGNTVAQAYRVFKEAQDAKVGDILRHGTFIVDRDGTVQWVNVGDAPFRRNSALLYQLAKLAGRLPSEKVILPGGTLP
jgi:thioredoxin-dependent peroxiredoxin